MRIMMTAICAFVVLAMPDQAVAQTRLSDLNVLPGMVMTCSQITSSPERLQCYDDLGAAVRETYRAMSARARFAWAVREIGPTGDRSHVAAVASQDVLVGTESTRYTNSLFLTLECRNSQLSLYVALPFRVGEQPVNAVVRVDAGNSGAMQMTSSVSGMSLGFWRIQRGQDQFLAMLRRATSVSFDMTLPEHGRVVAQFEVVGMEVAVAPVLRSCGFG